MQTSFFPVEQRARARRSDPRTSHDAASRVNVSDTQRLVLAVLIKGPATDDEIYRRICNTYPDSKVTPQSVRSRRSELCDPRRFFPPKVTFAGTYGTSEHGGRSREWRLA